MADVTKDVLGVNVSAAKTKSGQTTWMLTAENPTVQISVATMASASVVPANVRSGRILQKSTVASTVSATTSTATALATCSAEVRVTEVNSFESMIDLTPH